MLTIIDDYLQMLINNNLPITNTNFDNLYCVEYSEHDIVSNIIKFDTKTLQFIGDDGQIYNIDNQYILNRIKNKLNTTKPTSQLIKLPQAPKLTTQPQVTPKLTQAQEPKIIKCNTPQPSKSFFPVSELQQLDSTITEPTPELKVKKTKTADDLLKMMNDLKELKKKEEEKLESLKLKVEDEDVKLSKLSDDLGDERRMFQKNKDKEDENKNIFKADKKAYYLLKQDIQDKKTTEEKISKLFKDKYPIFKFMDSRNILGTDDEYVQYVSIYNELYPKQTYDIEKYVPHNIHYLNEEEKEKYNNIKNSNKDMLNDFLGKNIKPLEEVLADIDKDDNNTTNDSPFGDVTFDLNN
jgi:hypothetical protein